MLTIEQAAALLDITDPMMVPTLYQREDGSAELRLCLDCVAAWERVARDSR